MQFSVESDTIKNQFCKLLKSHESVIPTRKAGSEEPIGSW
jgi:hypothetical protein